VFFESEKAGRVVHQDIGVKYEELDLSLLGRCALLFRRCGQ